MGSGGEAYGGTGITLIPENKVSEASAALAVLGYSQSEIGMALKGIDMDGLPLMDMASRSGGAEDRMDRAALGPTPETLISI